ncbi:MAG: hypothetical protein E2O39_16865 [Planctomycetota bacterium]|nr:MAG: hypothetical protein E2O39_16865 [Planctomycetota bacterium]
MMNPRVLTLALFALLFQASATANDLVTSFEFLDDSGFIRLGSHPRFTGFEGGAAAVAPPGLSHTGTNAWLFQEHASVHTFPTVHVEFWLRDESASVASQVRLFDMFGAFVARFNGRADAWVHVVAGDATHRISRIQFSNEGAGVTAIDDFSTCGGASIGTNYCATTPSCFGLPPLMSAFGSTSISANDLFLFAGPAQNPGVFQYGLDQVQTPFGNNFICVAGPGNRIGFSFFYSSNYIGMQVDLDAPAFAPFPITAGSTWNFQAWHRDHCGAGHLTDGLEITFTP